MGRWLISPRGSLWRRRSVRSVHDCSIVATMLTHGIKRIDTRNASDFDRYYDEIRIDAVAP